LLNELIQQGKVQLDTFKTLPECEKQINFAISPEGKLKSYNEKSFTDIGILGYLDIYMPDGSILDIKTSSRAKTREEIEYSLQFGLYSAYVYSQITGSDVKISIHNLIKTKVPKVEVIHSTFTQENIKELVQQTVALVNSIKSIKRTEDFYINPNNLCRNYCDYKDLCNYGKRLCDESKA